MPEFFPDDYIRNRIHVIRRHPVVPLSDLARLYGVARNQLLAHAKRFPGDFCFELEGAETLALHDGPTAPRQRTYAFTEHGASVVAYLLATPRAMAVSAQIRRAFRQIHDSGLNGLSLVDRRNEVVAPKTPPQANPRGDSLQSPRNHSMVGRTV